MAVAVALQTATTTVTGIGDAAVRALATMRQVMPALLRHRVDALQVTPVGRSTRQLPQVDAEDLIAIRTAVRAREVLRFDYARTDDAPHPRRTEPHHLVTWGGRWYVVGWDLDRGDWRTFRVDRMTPKSPTGPRFTPRELPAPDVATYIAGKFEQTRWPCEGEVILDAAAGEVVRWMRGQGVVEALGSQRCRLTLGSWSWAGLAASVGMFDVDLEIVGPPELREAAAALARRYTAASG